MGKLNNWTDEEDSIIKTYFDILQSRKWKNISKILLEKGFQRGEAQCRQRYVNHLDPLLDKNSQFSEDQLQILYMKYQEYGPKWCLIQTFIPNRTQIKIKNLFYGNVRLFLKKLYKYFTKKTSVFINKLKTDDLQNIYDGTQEFSGLGLIKKALKKFHYKINQQHCFQVISKNQNAYLELLNKIIQNRTKMQPLKKLNGLLNRDFSEKKMEKNKQQLAQQKNSLQQQISVSKKLNQARISTENKHRQVVQQTLNQKQLKSPFPGIFQTQFFYNFPLCSSYFPNQFLTYPCFISQNFSNDDILEHNNWQINHFHFEPSVNPSTINSDIIQSDKQIH